MSTVTTVRPRGIVRIPAAEDDPIIESALLESDDGLVFRYHARFQEEFGDETAFLFGDDGDLLAVSRSGGGRNAQLIRSTPPFTEFARYREAWSTADAYVYPGPIQYFGPPEVTDRTTVTLQLEATKE